MLPSSWVCTVVSTSFTGIPSRASSAAASEETLRETDQDQEEVGYPLPLLGADGHEGHRLREIVDPVVAVRGDALLGELGDDGVELVVERGQRVVLLDLLGEDEGPSLLADPPLDRVDLVQSDDERGLVLPEDADGLDGLGHQPLPDVDDEDRDVRQGSPSGP